MPQVLHEYDYIFAITTIFAFLDAWNIGKHPPVPGRSLNLDRLATFTATTVY